MKKLLGSTLALSMFFPGSTVSAAELLKNFKLGGQIDLQATSASNVTDFQTQPGPIGSAPTRNDRIGDAQTRVMVHMDWDLLDDVHTKVTLRKNDRTYGTAGGTVQTPASVSQPLGTAGANILGTVHVDQAWVKIDKLGGHVDATMGRQFYGTSGDIVAYYGPSDKAAYGLWVTAIDAVRADWNGEMFDLTGLVGKMTGHAVGVAATPDVDVRALNAAIKGSEMWNAGAYVYNMVTHNVGAVGVAPASGGATAGGKNDFLWVVGLKSKVNLGMAWVAAEFAKNFGENRSATAGGHGVEAARYTGYAAKLDLGAKVELGGFGAVAPWAHAAYGSGDAATDNRNHNFTAISPDYRPGSIYGRFANGVTTLGSGVGAVMPQAVASNSLSNRAILGVGVKTTPSALNKLTAGISYWHFNFARETDPRVRGKRHIGSEVDLDLTWAHSENVSLGAGVAQFWTGGYINNSIQQANTTGLGSANSQRGVNPAKLAYFDVRVKF